jgi:hypothetical protein
MVKYQSTLSDLISLLSKVLEEHNLDETPYDLSDIGNVIGLSIGKHVDKTEKGWNMTDLFHGITQGASIHNKPFDTIVKGEL